MQTDDGSIIRDCLNGESEAFGILVDKYKAGIFALAHAQNMPFRGSAKWKDICDGRIFWL